MKNIIKKLAIATLVIGSVSLIAMAFASDHYWCFEDHDTCAVKEMDHYRKLRDKALADAKTSYDAAVTSVNDFYNNKKINPIKPTISAGRALEEYKKGNKQNVPEGFVALRQAFIPQAQASTGDTITEPPVNNTNIADAVSVRFAPRINAGRYSKILAEKSSPYASLPIEKYCDESGLNARQCDLILGVADHESKSGTDFKCDYKTKTVANLLGQFYYHNPVGIKDFDKDGSKKNPDENGCYLKKFDSFETFWKWYIPHMVTAYDWDNVTDVTYLSGCYVKGVNQSTKKCLSPAYGWANTVHLFAARVVELN